MVCKTTKAGWEHFAFMGILYEMSEYLSYVVFFRTKACAKCNVMCGFAQVLSPLIRRNGLIINGLWFGTAFAIRKSVTQQTNGQRVIT